MGISSYIEAGYGAAELRERIQLLESERALAGLTGLDTDPAYMADLQADIVAASAPATARPTPIAPRADSRCASSARAAASAS